MYLCTCVNLPSIWGVELSMDTWKYFSTKKIITSEKNVLQRPKHANKSCVMAKNETVCDNWKKVHTGNVK